MAGGMDVQAVLTANTAGFDGPMEKSAKVVTATGQATEKASKKAAEAQAFAAKFAADAVSQQSLRIIASKRAEYDASADFRKVQVLVKAGLIEEAEGANVSAAAYQRLTAAKVATAEASVVATHASVSQQQAASAAVRGLEGNVGIRSVERFLITIPGVGAALQNIFPLIGAVAFAGIIVKMGTELYDLEQKGSHAAKELDRSFGEMNGKLETTNDELALRNSKLVDQLGILSKHPTNGVETALLEAQVAADKLQDSLAGDLKALKSLMKEHEVGGFTALLSNVGRTTGTNSEINKVAEEAEREGQKAKIAQGIALREAGTDHAKQEAATKAYFARMDAIAADGARKMRARATDVVKAQKFEDDMADAAARNGGMAKPRDLSDQRVSFEDAAVTFDDVQRRAQISGITAENEKRVQAAEGMKKSASDANAANEKRLKAMEAQLAEMKNLGSVSAKSEYEYWDMRRSAFAAGSQQYNQIVEKQATLAVEGARRAAEIIRKARHAGDHDEAAETGVERALADVEKERKREADARARASDERADMSNELSAVNQRNDASLRSLEISEALGKSITKVSAETQLAAIHTASYGAEMARLNAKAQQVAQASYLSDADKEKQLGQIAIQGANLQTSRAEQIMQDRARMTYTPTSAGVGAHDALDEFVNSTRDAAKEMREITSNTLNAANRTILNAITGSGQRGQWSGLGKGIATDVAGGALGKAEGTILGAFGFGSSKAPTGRKGDALHTIIENLPGVSIPSISGGTATGMGGLSVKGIGQMLMGFLPGFANGVDDFGGGLAMVGERGPELVNLPRGSSVTPNGKFGSMGGDSHTWNIDARGSNDPAAVRALVIQGIQEATPHIVKAASQSSADQTRRTPRSR